MIRTCLRSAAIFASLGLFSAVYAQAEIPASKTQSSINLTNRYVAEEPSYPSIEGQDRDEVKKWISKIYTGEWTQKGIDQSIKKIAKKGLPAVEILTAHLDKAPLRVRLAVMKAVKLIASKNDTAGDVVLYAVLRQLSDVNWEVRINALEIVIETKRDGLLPYIIDALSDSIWRVRKTAAFCLSKIEDPQIAPILFQALQEEQDEEVKVEMVMALGNFGYEPARESFYYYLESKSSDVTLSCRSLSALIQIDGLKDPRIEKGLRDMLDLFDTLSGDKKRIAILKEAFEAAGPLALHPMLEKFQSSENQHVLDGLSEVLMGIKTDEMYAAIAEILKKQDGHKGRIMKCILILRQASEEQQFVFFKDVIETSESQTVRIRSIEGLKKNDADEVKPFIVTLLASEKSVPIVNALLNVVSSNPGEAYVEALKKIIQSDADSQAQRFKAVKLLSRCLTKKGIYGLVEVMRGIDNEKIKNEIMTRIVSQASPNDPDDEERFLVFYKEELNSDSVEIQKLAVKGIGNLDALSYRETFQTMALDRQLTHEVRSEIVRVLVKKKWMDESSKPVFLKVFEGSPEIGAKVNAIKGLAKYPDQKVWTMFVNLIQSEIDPTVRKSLVEAIRTISATLADARNAWLPKLFPLLGHEDESVRQAIISMFNDTVDERLVLHLHRFIELEGAEGKLAKAYTLLAKQKDLRSTEIFLDVLKNSDVKGYRKAAIYFAGEVKMKESLAFIHAEVGESKWLKSPCLVALGKIKDPSSIPFLIQELGGSYEAEAITALGNFNSEKADSEIILYLQNKYVSDSNAVQQKKIAEYLRERLASRTGFVMALYKGILATHPKSREAALSCWRLAAFYSEAGDEKLAFDYRKRTMKLVKELSLKKIDQTSVYRLMRDVYKKKAESFLEKNEVDEILKVFEDYLTLDDSARAHNYVAWTLAEKNIAHAKAIEWAIIADEKNPHQAFILDTLAWAYYRNEDYERAETKLLEAEQLEADRPVVGSRPERQDYRYHLSIVYARLGNDAEVLKRFAVIVEKTDLYSDQIVTEEAFQELYVSNEAFRTGYETLKKDQHLSEMKTNDKR